MKEDKIVNAATSSYIDDIFVNECVFCSPRQGASGTVWLDQ